MKVLILHNNFPAQFGHIATALAADPANTVIFGTGAKGGSLPGVHKLLFEARQTVTPQTHYFARSYDRAVRNGEALFNAAKKLKERGFEPDVVYGHSGWGPTLFVKDLWPDTKLVGYFEWFYRAEGSDVGFLPENKLTDQLRQRVRALNAPILMDIAFCEWAITPTEWQRSHFPEPFRSRMQVLHDGVDTDYFSPDPESRLVLEQGLDLSAATEVITYVARGMEPYRGFPQFMRAAALIQKRRPNAHIVVVGKDRVAYGSPLPDGQTYKQKMLAELELDHDRLHFTDLLPYGEYRKVIRASAAHIYLTIPFVLSWSMLETMAVGGIVIGSDTPPVRELITDGVNGLLVDFFSPEAVADQVDRILASPDRMTGIRREARRTIVEKYSRKDLLPEQLRMLREVAQGQRDWRA